MRTPNIDALAASSIVFTRAHTHYTLCGPSRTAFLTGRRPDTTQVFNNGGYWRETSANFSSMPQYFKENGYSTYASGKLYHADDDNAFSWTEDNYRPTTDDFWHLDGLSWGSADPEVIDTIPLPCMQIRDFAIDKLRQAANESNPFFIAVGFQKPHLPFLAPEEFYSWYPEEDIYLPENPYVPLNHPEIAWSGWTDLPQYVDIQEFNNTYNSTLPDYKTLELRRAYYATVSYVDSLVGELLEEMRILGLESTTTVSFQSDHGWHLGEKAEWAKTTNFELDTRVPLMLKIPGVTDDGYRSDEFVELVDLFSTLVDIVDLESVSLCPQENASSIKVCHEGRSILQSIETQEWKNAAFSQIRRDDNMGHCIHTREYNYVRWMPIVDSDNNVDWNNVTAEEFYDLSVDPNQNENVANYPEYAELQGQASERLLAGWRAELP